MGHSKGRQSIVSSCSYTLLRDRSRTLLNLRILPSEHGGHPHPPVCEHMHTRPCPQHSPGIGVLVVTAVMQKFHHGLQGKVEGGWSQETGRGQQPSTPTPPHTHTQPTGLRGLTLEVLARSCCSSRGDVTVGMRQSGDRFSLFCWGGSGRLAVQPVFTHCTI